MLKISIIVPVYNTEEYLRECFDSIIAQTYSQFEVIVVDDGSSDGSGAICDEYANKDSRFRVIHQINQGVSMARNAALEVVTGDYVGFVDSDDTFLPEMVSGFVQVIQDTNAEIVQSITYLDNKGLAKYGNISFIHIFDNEEARKEFFTIGEVRPSVCLSLIKKEIIGNLRFPPHIVQWEDYAFIGLLVSKSNIVAVTSKLYYKYRYRAGSATKQSFNDRHLTCLLIDELFMDNNVYKTEQERHDVVGFFVRCCCLGYINSNCNIRRKYRKLIRRKIIDNKHSIQKCRPIPFRTKVIIFSILFSEFFAKILWLSETKIVSLLIGLRNGFIIKHFLLRSKS